MTLEQACREKIRESLTMLGHDSLYVEVVFDLRGNQAGIAMWSSICEAKLIRLNRELLYKHGPEFLAQTPGHEVCHLVQSVTHPKEKQRHGRVWQHYMRKLGLDPRRCHRYDSKPSRIYKTYEFSCQCRTYNLTRVRIKKIAKAMLRKSSRSYLCQFCRTKLVPSEKAQTRILIEKYAELRKIHNRMEKESQKFF